jgi:hypothetical protein
MGSRTTILEPQEDSLLTIEMYEADDKERDILKMVDGKTTLYDLCARGPYPAAEIARILYGLFSLKLIRRKKPVQVVSSFPHQDFA